MPITNPHSLLAVRNSLKNRRHALLHSQRRHKTALPIPRFRLQPAIDTGKTRSNQTPIPSLHLPTKTHHHTNPLLPLVTRLHRLRRSFQTQHPRPLPAPPCPRARPARTRRLRKAQERVPRFQAGGGLEEFPRAPGPTACGSKSGGGGRQFRSGGFVVSSGCCHPPLASKGKETIQNSAEEASSNSNVKHQELRRTLHPPPLHIPNFHRPIALAKPLSPRLDALLLQPRHELPVRPPKPPSHPLHLPHNRASRHHSLLPWLPLTPSPWRSDARLRNLAGRRGVLLARSFEMRCEVGGEVDGRPHGEGLEGCDRGGLREE